MTIRRSPQDIIAEDARWKPGTSFNDDAIKLSALLDNRGRRITHDFLRQTGMGDPSNQRPLNIGIVPRLTESLSVLYSVPATRRLKRNGDVLDDAEPDAVTFAELSRRMCLDNVWQIVDARRNLLRQCVLVFVESQAHQSVQARVFSPFDVFRMPTASAADALENDEAFLLKIRDGAQKQHNVYQLWQQENDGWHVWIVDESGAFVGEQPYGESGLVPFGELPALIIYDALPVGAAYLPIPESRLDFALNINALANDIGYLVKLEAHTIKAVTSDDMRGVPTQIGPDKVWVLPGGSDVKVLGNSPKIADANQTLEQNLAMLALSESLPGDFFSASRKVYTGPALKTAERDRDVRRQRQMSLASNDERRSFPKIRAIHNHFCEQWGMSPLAEDTELLASFGRQWQPTDAKDLQEVWFKDLAIGAGSLIGYLQERYNCDRAQAVDMYHQIQEDRRSYPVEMQQNPAALVDGPNAAVGTEMASKVDGAFNPDLSTSTDGASVTDAARQSLMM